MQDTRHTIWIERLSGKIRLPYPVTAALVAGIIFAVYRFLSTKIVFFPWEFFHQLEVIPLCILIWLQLAGIIYLVRETDRVFRTFVPVLYDSSRADALYRAWQLRFYTSRWYYLLVALVVVPYVLLFSGIPFYQVEPTVWSLILDVLNMASSWFSLFLFAITLWIIINMIWFLDELGGPVYGPLIRLDILAVDRIGGLKPIRDLIIKILSFYFICITLDIISYVSPFSIFGYESMFIIVLMAAGLGLFIFSTSILRRLVRGRIEEEINRIDGCYKAQQDKLMKITSETISDTADKALELVRKSLDSLDTQRERMLRLYTDSRGYDIVTVAKFASSFVLSLIAFLDKILEFTLKYIKLI